MMRRTALSSGPLNQSRSSPVLRQKNPRARQSPEDTPAKEMEPRKRKIPPGLISPESSENKPEVGSAGVSNPAPPKKKKVGPEPRPRASEMPSSSSASTSTSRNYGGEDVMLLSEVEDEDDEGDAEEMNFASVLTRNRFGKEGEQSRPRGLALKTKRARMVETPVQQTARKLAKEQDKLAKLEAQESLRLLDEMVADLDKAPKPNFALQQYQEQRTVDKEQGQYSGIIKRLRLFNFMCHESFDKEWHNNINFITGQNGSGKSAILSGILVGLGARALTTSRTKSISGLVKTGKEFCKIEITLINYGVLSDRYGKEIMIQRIIDSNGVSGYKIDDGKSRLRVLKRAELDNILATLGIMLDNPVAILNQETARSFLRSKDPRDKYHLFYEGTNLGRCKRILDEIKANLESTKQNFRNCREVLESQKEEKEKLKKRMQRFLELDKMDEQIDKLSREYHWALVISDEKAEAKLKKDLEREIANRDSLKTTMQDLMDKKNKLIEENGLAPQNQEEARTQLRDAGRRDRELQLELSKLSRELANAKVTIRTTTNQITTKQKTITILTEKVEHMRTVGKAEADQAREEFEEKKAELEQEQTQKAQEYQTAKQDSEQFKHGADSAKNELNLLEDKNREFTFGLERNRRELQSLRSNGPNSNKYECYGRPMVELMAKIQANTHRFRKPPRGPIGSCFTVKNEKWLKLVEFILKDKLYDFIVDNTEDMKLMNELIKQTFLRGPSGDQRRRLPTVMVSKYAAQAFDVSRTKATTRNHPTVLDAIEIENNDFIISNALIDSSQIEKVLLIEDNKTALDLLKDCHHPEFPRTCLRAWTLEYYRIMPDPKFRIDPYQKPQRDFSIVKCSSKVQVRALERAIQEIQVEKQELAPILESKRQEEASNREQFNKLNQILQRSQRKLQEVKIRIASLAKTVISDPDIDSFVEEIEEVNVELNKNLADQAEAEKRLDEIQPQITTLRTEREELGEKLASLQQHVDGFQEKQERFQAKLELFENHIRKAKSLVRDSEVKCDSLNPKLERIAESITKRIGDAEKHGERVDTDRSPDTLQNEHQEFCRRVEEAKKDAGDRVKVAQSLKAIRRKWSATDTQYNIWFKIFQLIANSYAVKSQFFDLSVRFNGQMLCTFFHSLIGFRQYQGRLMIDDERKELIYFVCPDDQADAKTKAALASNNDKYIKQYFTEYTSGLSGGERSFATICFIISMWQIMECPFFMLDEFDVFMDAFNRRTSQNALIAHAKKYKSHQYFLFTPLDLTEMPKPGEATVLRMFPPVRTADEPAESEEEELADDIETPMPGPSRGGSRRRR